MFRKYLFPPVDVRLHKTLEALDAAIRPESCVKDILAALDRWKGRLYKSLANTMAPLPAKSLTIKILNLFLSKYHFLTRSTILLSSPYGILVDPMNGCQLACPGCVHSARSKELRLFDWVPGVLTEPLFADFMRRYGPYAIQTDFYNYGEPLLNPNTPRFIHIAKTYLARTSVSTNMNVKHFDAEAYITCGLDYMTLSIDGATQNTYERYRRKGDLEAVFTNVRSLLQTRTRMGKLAPLVSWQYLAFEHNEHEIDDAIRMAEQLGVDRFILGSPYEVSWDDPSIRPSKQAPRVVWLHSDAATGAVENWNPFPSEIDAGLIEQQFDANWQERVANENESEDGNVQVGLLHTCHYLYKNIVMDARGRIMPCCAAPRPDADLVFGSVQSGTDVFNSEKYRLARLSFADPRLYQIEQASIFSKGPHCAQCEWDQSRAQIDKESLENYFAAVGNGVFNSDSTGILSSW